MDPHWIHIECEVLGDPSAPPLLLIRGVGTQMSQWPTSILDGILEAGLRVVRFDNRDVGLSTKLAAAGLPNLVAVMSAARACEPSPAPYPLDAMAEDCIGLLDALGIERAHVLGMSMGGRIAQLVALGHPQRTRSLISVMSSSGDPSVPPATPLQGLNPSGSSGISDPQAAYEPWAAC